MTPQEVERCGISKLDDHEIEALISWGNRLFALGERVVYRIESISDEGDLILLDDGSKWAIAPSDCEIASHWGKFDFVAVSEAKMYLIDERQYVAVTEIE